MLKGGEKQTKLTHCLVCSGYLYASSLNSGCWFWPSKKSVAWEKATWRTLLSCTCSPLSSYLHWRPALAAQFSRSVMNIHKKQGLWGSSTIQLQCSLLGSKAGTCPANNFQQLLKPCGSGKLCYFVLWVGDLRLPLLLNCSCSCCGFCLSFLAYLLQFLVVMVPFHMLSWVLWKTCHIGTFKNE